MFGSIKALIVVLTIGCVVFHLARPIATQFIDVEDFSRRRFVWIALTSLYFILPNFWLYVFVAVPILLWANRHDSNPIGLYLLMLHVIPPVSVPIPLLGNNGLFPLDNYGLLAFCVLWPAVLRHRKKPAEGTKSGFDAMDFLLMASGVLQVLLYIPPDLPHHYLMPDSLTNAIRRGFLFFLDTYLLYFTISRTCQSRRKLVDAAASYCLACAVMAAIAMFENLRGWLLYVDVASLWGNNPAFGFYLMRGGAVRAQTSAGHSIAEGYLLAVGFGLWLYLRPHIENRLQRIGTTVLLLGGLYATTSRGSWLGAAVIYFAFLAASPRAISRLMKGAVAAAVLAGLIVISPIGDKVLELLPQSGQPADIYRHRLAERGWELVMAHPFFGDQFPWPEMEDLRQGEGIIDIVNTYLGVGLNYGLIGLICFMGVMLIGARAVYSRTRELALSDPDLSMLGTSILACIAGTLIMIDSDSFTLGIQKGFYMLAALAAAYAKMTLTPRQPAAALPAGRALQG